MPCIPVDFGNGVRALVCDRGRKPRRCACCTRPGTSLCDGPAPPNVRRKTCDARICSVHSTSVGADRDLCPACVTAFGAPMSETFADWYAAKSLEARREFWSRLHHGGKGPKGWPTTFEQMESEQAQRLAAQRVRKSPAAVRSRPAPIEEVPVSEQSEKVRLRITIVEGELYAHQVAPLVLALRNGEDVKLPGVDGVSVRASQPALPEAEKAAPKKEAKKAPPAPQDAPAPPPPTAPAPAAPVAPAPAAAPSPPPVAPAAPKPTSAGQLTEAAVLEVAECKKLADVLRYMKGKGIEGLPALVAECARLRQAVPIIARVPEVALAERIEFTLEGIA